jgi:YVTN family beta-propeller protein
VSVLDTETNTIAAIVPVGSFPLGVAVNPTGTRVYATNASSNTVSVIDTTTNSVITTVPVGSIPRSVAVDPSGARIYVANYLDGTLSVIDATTNAVIATIPVETVSYDHPTGIVVHPTGNSIYVLHDIDSAITVVDSATNAVTGTINDRSDLLPVRFAINPAGTTLYVAHWALRNGFQTGTDIVTKIDIATNAVTASIHTGDSPTGIVFQPTGIRFYVANYRSVSVIDAATSAIIAAIPMSFGPKSVAINPAGTRTYVTNPDANTVSVIDTTANTLIATIPVTGPGGISIVPPAPACTLTALPSTITAGGSATLTATCIPAATSYAWTNTGFAATASAGTVSPTVTTTYSVIGSNAAGSGNTASATVTVTPSSHAMVELTGISKIAAGGNHTCALTTAGGVKCWGANGAGQLGDNTTTQRFTPVDVSGLASGVVAIAAGGGHTCALTTAGGVKCWGYNGAGQLGDNSTTSRLTPVDVPGLTSGVAAIAAGKNVFGGDHTCALTTADGAKCWGSNGNGQLGDGTTTQRLTPVDVSGLVSGMAAITASGAYTCALTTAGGAKCWGYNGYGQLGDNSFTQRLTPIDVFGLASGMVAIAASGDHACALTTEGGVKCWGNNFAGQLGDNTYDNLRNTPVDVSGLANGVAAIAAAGDLSFFAPPNLTSHTCALTATGGVKCWGLNAYGQLGDNSFTSRSTPVDVSGLASGVGAITAGFAHTCALTTEGGVKCWGSNQFGQLGDGTSSGSRPFPAPVMIPTPPPQCTLTASPSTITLGGSATLTAACNPDATSYAWTPAPGLVAGPANTAVVTPTAIGTFQYSVTGSNADGTGNTASTSVTVICSYSIPASQSVAAIASTGTLSVTSPSGCAWTASSNVEWITITSGSSGSGNGTVAYAVAANPSGSSRIGTLTIARRTFTVTQAGLTVPAFNSQSDCLFNWAERIYPNLFAPMGAISNTLAPYYYRYYPQTNAYLGTSSADNHVYYIGPLSNNSLLDVGALSPWLSMAGCQ